METHEQHCREIGIANDTRVDWRNFSVTFVRNSSFIILFRSADQVLILCFFFVGNVACSLSFVELQFVGIIVEVDESMAVKRKYDRGRMVANQVWLFGSVERDTNGVECFIVPVVQRNHQTLLPLIQQLV